MHPEPRNRDTETWPITLAWLIIGFACYALPWHVLAAELPASQGAQPVLQVQGSNTIGAHLLPELVQGLMLEQGYKNVHVTPTSVENEQLVSGQRGDGKTAVVAVAAHGSSTGFVALKAGTAEIAAASRAIKDSEAQGLSAFGNLRSAKAEQVIGIDGLAIIVNPANPLSELSTDQLARVFSGEAKTWEDVGGHGGAIHLYARDDNSGTFDTFKELVLVSHGKALVSGTPRFESSDELSAAVSRDVQGIGFVGLSSVLKAKALSISDGESRAMQPSTALVATEDYPLSRRLYLYIKPAESNPWAQALVQFARPYIYTTSQPPALACATLKSLQLLRDERWRREHLGALIRQFRQGAQQIGLALMDSPTAIQPILVGDAARALTLSKMLRARGLLVTAIRPPTVPVGSARLRVTLSAAHSEAQVQLLLNALAECHAQLESADA
ncbi:MAG: 8-amino-7-oxononanoate synthase [Pseudomonas citronellolis]|nr:MAG: 8-amino-7-oxononanoate synthase [Pseudomonas citronellolis]